MTEKERHIWKILGTVIDPELMLNIVDLGLVYEVGLDEANKCIAVRMTLTSQGCPLGDAILGEVHHRLQADYPDYLMDIQLVWEPPWSLNRLTEKGKEFLGRN